MSSSKDPIMAEELRDPLTVVYLKYGSDGHHLQPHASSCFGMPKRNLRVFERQLDAAVCLLLAADRPIDCASITRDRARRP
jgi:hypothetical protein